MILHKLDLLMVVRCLYYWENIKRFGNNYVLHSKSKKKKAMQACIIPRHEISIQYKCKEYLNDIQRLICANKIMKYEIICGPYQGKTRGPVNAHLISWPSKAQNIQNLEIYGKEMTLTFNTHTPS